MSDNIELVIKIPEEWYTKMMETRIILGGVRSGKTLMSVLYDATVNGTPLPKGHGRLIDADRIMRVDHIVLESTIDDARTIIEADKESEDKE